MEIKDLDQYIQNFVRERNWNQFHYPKNLLISLAAEVGELMECFQWKTDEALAQLVQDYKAGKEDALAEMDAIGDEIADVGVYLLELCHSLGVDFEEQVLKKMKKNALKYPVEKCFGKADKYTELK